MKKLSIIIILLFSVLSGYSQIDTLFWFAVPEVDDTHGDQPILLRFVTNSEDSDISISVPASDNFETISLSLPAKSTETVDLTEYKTLLENTEFDIVSNKGLLIRSSNPISAYYEVSNVTNADVFSLKGTNGLGESFYACFQNHWHNKAESVTLPWRGYPSQNTWATNSWSSIDIVATEDGTVIEIVPTADIEKSDGTVYPENIPFSISLNRGQTYSAKAASRRAEDHLDGTKITVTTPDKPIAVTVKDDGVLAFSEETEKIGGDLLGDQLIPVGIIGKDYIVMKGDVERETALYNDDYLGERVFVVATQDDTRIQLFSPSGGQITEQTIDEQETASFLIDNYQYTKISANKDVYVFHVSGFRYELAAAVIPPLKDCSGTQKMAFTKAYEAEGDWIDSDENFRMNIMVKQGAEGCFTISGTEQTWLTADDFTPIPNSEWSYATIIPTNEQVSVNNTYFIENQCAIFHLGVLNVSKYGSDKAAFYGYFSSFYQENLQRFISGRNHCVGDTVVMAGSGSTYYKWNGPTQYLSSLNNDTVYVTGMPAGSYRYFLEMEDPCGNKKVYSMYFTVHEYPSGEIEGEPEICLDSVAREYSVQYYEGATYNWDVQNANIELYEDSFSPYFSFQTEGTATLSVAVDNNGCAGTLEKEVRVVEMPVPEIEITDNLLCEGETITIPAEVNTSNNTISWYGRGIYFLDDRAVLQPNFTAQNAGVFDLRLRVVNDNTCIAEEEIEITVYTNPVVDAGADTTVFYKQSIEMTPEIISENGYNTLWTPAEVFEDNSIENAQTNQYVWDDQWLYLTAVDVESGAECSGKDSLFISVKPRLIFTSEFSNDTICRGDQKHFEVAFEGGNEDGYLTQWYVNGVEIDGENTNNLTLTMTEPINTVKVEVTDLFDTIEGEFMVYTLERPDVRFDYEPKEDIYPHDTIVFINQTEFVNYENLQFYWEFDGNRVEVENNDTTSFIYEKVGEYHPSLIAEDVVSGCITEYEKPLTVEANPICRIVYPNTVLPLKPDDNVFTAEAVKGIDVDGFKVRIYNRYGQKLYESENLQFEWDCIYNGKPVTQDVYVYQCEAMCEDGRELLINGDITVLK